MNTIRIICLNDAVYNRIREMWVIENKFKKIMLKQFVETKPFEDGKSRGFDLRLLTKLIEPKHLLSNINSTLMDEGFSSKDFNIEVL